MRCHHRGSGPHVQGSPQRLGVRRRPSRSRPAVAWESGGARQLEDARAYAPRTEAPRPDDEAGRGPRGTGWDGSTATPAMSAIRMSYLIVDENMLIVTSDSHILSIKLRIDTRNSEPRSSDPGHGAGPGSFPAERRQAGSETADGRRSHGAQRVGQDHSAEGPAGSGPDCFDAGGSRSPAGALSLEPDAMGADAVLARGRGGLRDAGRDRAEVSVRARDRTPTDR